MLQIHSRLDQGTTAFDKNPRWDDSWATGFDLCLLPSAIEDMDRQGRGYDLSYAIDKPMPPEIQRLYSQRRLPHSPIDSPTAWSRDLTGYNGQYESSQPTYHGQYPPPTQPVLSIPENGPHAGSWPGGHTEVDASSTLSPMSPKTPVAKSEIEVKVASPWTAPPSTMVHQQSHFTDFKQEIHYPHGGAGVSLQQISPHDDNGPVDFPAPGTPGSLDPPYPRGSFRPDLSHPNGPEAYNCSQATLRPSVLQSPMERSMADEADERDEAMTDAPGDDDSEYDPSGQNPHTSSPASSQSRQPGNRQAKYRSQGPLAPQAGKNRIAKRLSTSRHSQPLRNIGTHLASPSALPSSTSATENTCVDCVLYFTSPATYNKHIQTKHTRPFSCIFRRYGCSQTFGSKNEWTRHIRVQHLRLEGWRCDVGKCGPDPRNKRGGDRHSFDRKDLFTQHLRRMHKELYNKTYLARYGGNKGVMEAQVQDRCHVRLREAPSGGTCAYSAHPLASTTTTSSSAGDVSACRTEAGEAFDTWETYLEHVARHLEKGLSANNDNGIEDLALKKWLIDQRLLQPLPDRCGRTEGWKIVGCEGKKSNTSSTRDRGLSAGRRTRKRKAGDEDEDEDADGDWVDE